MMVDDNESDPQEANRLLTVAESYPVTQVTHTHLHQKPHISTGTSMKPFKIEKKCNFFSIFFPGDLY